MPWQGPTVLARSVSALRVLVLPRVPREPATTRLGAWDVPIAILLAVAAGAAVYLGCLQVDPATTRIENSNVWFQSDLARVYSNVTNAGSNQMRACVHPLFSLVGYPSVGIIHKLCHMSWNASVPVFLAGTGVLWMVTLYLLLRLITPRRLDAVVFSLLASVSASAMFWFIVPETYGLGSWSLLACLCVVAISQNRELGMRWFVAASVVTFSFTVTNWMEGILASLVRFGWCKAVRATVYALCIVLVAWAGQLAMFQHNKVGYPLMWVFEKNYVLRAETGGPAHIARSFFFHSIVMPVVQTEGGQNELLSVQASGLGTGSPYAAPAAAGWAILLAAGLFAILFLCEQRRLRIVLGLTIAGQLALHLMYGEETFLYSLHFAPLLVLMTGLATRTRGRPVVLTLAAILTLLVALGNLRQLDRALAHYEKTQRHQVLRAMKERPDDPWPRGSGHVILAFPGTTEDRKSYHEPGGSFSPCPGSFGVSIWVVGADGRPTTTSDGIPDHQIEQRLDWSDGGPLPAIMTRTPDYECRWSSPSQGTWRLDLMASAGSTAALAIAVRSVGPAGGPIHTLRWADRQLIVNNRWELAVTPRPRRVCLGEETDDWQTALPGDLDTAVSEEGWAYARVDLPHAASAVTITDRQPWPSVELGSMDVHSSLVLDLPDKQFQDCLTAQVAHLMMSLVGQQTRPGDPMNYPLEWQRDGSYVLVALAMAGRLDTARDLSASFAAQDFFGGFGPEGDAPGLSLWALTEVAARLREPEFDRCLWPRIVHKVHLLRTMMTTRQAIRAPITSPIVPKLAMMDTRNDLVCKKSRGPLIAGRMDYAIQLLYVNAVSYGGLMRAADMAHRLGHAQQAEEWRTDAAELRQAWCRAFRPPETRNPRAYVASLWPHGVAEPIREAFEARLEERWRTRRLADGGFVTRPSWTYFEIAEAHQWLWLGNADRAWSTLRWFWDHQASPGLYTWWEGSGEVNSYHLWETVRGWVRPPYVTPHYWTAAEVLMLQLDMLTRLDVSGDEPILVIGEGIPKDWIAHSMKVHGVATPLGKVDWNWDGARLEVTIGGPPCDVRLGASFEHGTQVLVRGSR